MQKLFGFMLITLLSVPAFTCTEDGSEGIVEENDLQILANTKSPTTSGIDKDTYNKIINDISSIYTPIIRDIGARLVITKKWNSGTVNAYAGQRNFRGKIRRRRRMPTWTVEMHGGLARHQETTPDSLALILCHELGHHIGGLPQKNQTESTWATSEGQADYWATLKCMRKYLKTQTDTVEVLSTLEVPDTVKNSCETQFSTIEDQLICQRSSMAGLSTVKLFQRLEGKRIIPMFSNPDQSMVNQTVYTHPNLQCRLDTFFNGALCEVLETIDVDQSDARIGSCNRSERNDNFGSRPLCWYNPLNI